MPYTTLISPEEAKDHLNDSNWAFIDCRFSLSDTERGRREYLDAHIPGAFYAHLDEDLSGPVIRGKTGRHPLPDIQAFAKRCSDWGISRDVQAVVYDGAGGAIAARLWWMLRWLGHDSAAVLDGGWPAWQEAGLPYSAEIPEPHQARTFEPNPRAEMLRRAEDVERWRKDKSRRIIDARGPARYSGKQEPIDPVGGHVPGAVNVPFSGNLNEHGRMRSKRELRGRFEDLLLGIPPANTITYCGSGVTAAHNLLAMIHAGLPGGALYAGSWSDWITDPARPVAEGGKP